jgi:hypothetical protein
MRGGRVWRGLCRWCLRVGISGWVMTENKQQQEQKQILTG